MIKLWFHSRTVFTLLLAVLAAGPGVLCADATGDRLNKKQVEWVYQNAVTPPPSSVIHTPPAMAAFCQLAPASS